MTDLTHYDAILRRMRLHTAQLDAALTWKPSKKRDRQIAWSTHQIAMIERERKAESERCGMAEIEAMSDRELLDALLGNDDENIF